MAFLRWRASAALGIGLTVALTSALAGATTSATATSPAPPGPPARAAAPALRVTTVAGGLSQPWDVKVLPGSRFLITERESARLLLRRHGTTRRVSFPSGRVWVSGETGLMGLEVDPRFSKNRRIYTCQGWELPGGGHDIRVSAWKMRAGYGAVRLIKHLVTGLPSTSGRHGGCRLLIAEAGALLVGTGDAATGTNPQNLRSLGGKVLRLNRFSGKPSTANPWPKAKSANRRYVFTYGHRNVQGLAQRRDGTFWSVEHGTDRDDEVNLLRASGNYGWNPIPGYDESTPMTDFSLPGRQRGAKWKSGYPTLATSGAAWVPSGWGSYSGTLAVAALKASRLLFMRFESNGKLRWTRAPAALRDFGRLRSVTRAPNGDLLVTTANGSGDRVLRVSPR